MVVGIAWMGDGCERQRQRSPPCHAGKSWRTGTRVGRDQPRQSPMSRIWV